jgi:defect-in-organelle-trafficking protein DotB
MAWKTAEPVQYLTGFREPHQIADSTILQQLMLEVHAQRASDTIIQTAHPVLIEVSGDLHQLTHHRIAPDECLQVLNLLTNNAAAGGSIAEGKPVVGVYSVADPVKVDGRGEPIRHRFRINGSRISGRGGSMAVQIVIRSIAADPPTIAEVGLDLDLVKACTPRDGIIYVTGATGSGKSTTFAAITQHILRNDTPIKGNICTLEAPIEYVYDTVESVHSVVAQGQVGVGFDIDTFALGVRDLMRRHPALGIIGETRDWETASAAMELSNTGHPVFTTMHVNEVSLIPTRLLSLCPPEVKGAALFDFISTARVLINQSLARTVDGGRMALREHLIMTEDIRNELIDTADPQRITALMRAMVAKHGVTMESAAIAAFEAGRINDKELAKYRRARHG